MPRKPVIQTMVATSLALSGTAKAASTDSIDIIISDQIHADVLDTEFPDSPFFGQEIQTLIYGEDEIDPEWTDPVLVQEKTKAGERRRDVKERTLRERTKPRREAGAGTPRKGGGAVRGEKTDTARDAVDAARKRRETTVTGTVRRDTTITGDRLGDTTITAPTSDNTEACCTVYGGTGNDAVLTDRPILFGGENDPSVPSADELKSSTGTRLRSGGGGIKLRGQ